MPITLHLISLPKKAVMRSAMLPTFTLEAVGGLDGLRGAGLDLEAAA
jgi:hypothetical protein